MTTPNLKLPEWAAAQDQPWVPENATKHLIDALMPSVVASNTLTTPPASPAAGSCYIVAATATGLWAGWEDSIAAYIGGSWVQITPQEGWVFWVVSAARSYVYRGSWASMGGIYDIKARFIGAPSASQIMWFESCSRSVTLPANFEGSSGSVGVNPAANFDIDVQVGGVSIGTITITTLGVLQLSTTGGLPVQVDAGSRISLIAPASVDATISDIALAIVGSTDGSVHVPAAISADRWRVAITGVQSGALVASVGELDMMATIGGATVTTGGTAVAKTEYGGGEIATAAFDGLDSTWWSGASGDMPTWLEYQFAAPVAIVEVAMVARNDSYFYLTPSTFTIEYWDGSAWQEISAVAAGTWSAGLRQTFSVQ